MNGRYFVGQSLKNDEFNTTYTDKGYLKQKVVYSYFELTPRSVDLDYYLGFNPHTHPAVKIPFALEEPAELIKRDGAGDLSAPSTLKIIKNTPFEKEFLAPSNQTWVINVHDFPYWSYEIDVHNWRPDRFDLLGRPVWEASEDDKVLSVRVVYRQTPIEKLGNLLSLLSLGMIIILSLKEIHRPR